MHPVGLEPTTFGSEVVLYNVYPVFYVMLCAVFVDYVHRVKSSLLSIVVVRSVLQKVANRPKNALNNPERFVYFRYVACATR